MKVVLLCGGRGLRLMPHTSDRPKPMVEVGGRPLLWHIMRHYASHGFNDFVLCCGHKAEVVRKWSNELMEGWKIRWCYTGDETTTGGRLLRIREFLGDEPFMLTYGDGLSNVDIAGLVASHSMQRRAATITVVRPHAPWGVLDIAAGGAVQQFREKPVMPCWTSAGHFVMEPRVLDILQDGDCCVLEQALSKMADHGNLHAYRHLGWFRGVDSHQDLVEVRQLWDKGEAPWAIK